MSELHQLAILCDFGVKLKNLHNQVVCGLHDFKATTQQIPAQKNPYLAQVIQTTAAQEAAAKDINASKAKDQWTNKVK